MIRTLRRFSVPCLLAALVLVPARGQDALVKEEQDLARQCVNALTSFASSAKGAMVGQRAKQAYDLVLEYDPEQSTARSELGFRKEKGQWVELPPEKRKKWLDKATYEARFKTMDDWYKTSQKLATLHRALGLKLKAAGNAERAKFHLEKAVYYNPLDKEANEALGYKQGPGFYGTDEQIAFANRMKEVETRAIEIAKKDYPVEALPLDQMPKELSTLQDVVPDWMRKPHFDIFGAKSEHFTVWTRGTQENADNAVKWGERALDFGVYLLGDKMAKQLRFVEHASKSFSWYGFLWTARERDEFLKANPHIWEKEGSIDRARDFANNIWMSAQGPAVVMTKLAPVQIHDSMIGYVFKYGLVIGRNEGLGEGIVHAATWLLQSTSVSRWGARPEGTVGEDELNLPEQANWWLRAIRDQATSHQDWGLSQVPREKLERYRNDCRLKAWNFMTWVVAAYPDKWLQFFLTLPGKKIPTLGEVDEIGQKAFGKPLAAIETEWREWARGDSGVAAATGYGPPLLPERPSKEEVAVLERLNLVRGQGLAFSWPDGKMLEEGAFHGLPPCELDAEASLACEDHAHFLAKWPEQHLKWPEAHEENPGLDGFSPRGQRAGMSSVIVHRQGDGGVEFAKDSVDGWLGTPYHRFPLLVQNIRRFGYAYICENDMSIAVLDMGSLQEPYDPKLAPRLICWPPHNMKDVPTSFHGREQPNPLEDQPADEQDITKTGYPISVQLQRELAINLSESSIQVFEARKGGKQPTKNLCEKNKEDFRAWVERGKSEVPVWVHTPAVPLNRRIEERETIFCIPKEKLEAGKQYQVRVALRFGSAPEPLYFFWEFTTGSQKEGLKLK